MSHYIYQEKEDKIPLPNGKSLTYIPSPELREAVNLALTLKKRPLLLTGEPGVGKTLLAKAIAYQWHKNEYENHYFKWDIKSTSKATDGLYRYDALRRLSDAQIGGKLESTELGKKGSYFEFGEFTKAINASQNGKKSVLLIDEIDKADIDFPNDLLNELENYEFTIPETGEVFKRPDHFEYPLIIITSNQEKELPAAFLRRCIYFHIEFPRDDLYRIVSSHFLDENEAHLKFAVEAFLKLREMVEHNMPGMEKTVSTSEFIDWYEIVSALKSREGELSDQEKELLKKAKKWLDSNDVDKIKDIPFYQVLFKSMDSRKAFSNSKL